MTRPTIRWRLEEGYSRFLEGSQVEVHLVQSHFSAALDLFPLSLVRQKKPIEFRFRPRASVSGRSAAGLRWRLSPEGEIRGLLLFAGNPFLGNFRVPAGHFGVQWDIEARAEGSLSGEPGGWPLLGLRAGTRLYQSWVCLFSEPLSIAAGLKAAWQRYRDPFNPAEVQQMAEREVVRWRWEGHAQLEAEVSWGIGAVRRIPGSVPLVDFQKQLAGMAGLSASLVFREEGQFALQLRRHRGQLVFHLSRDRSRRTTGGFFVGVQLKEPIRFDHLGLKEPEPLEVVSEALGQPVVSRLNRICEEALTRRLRVGLSVSRAGWKNEKSILHAVWREPSLSEFAPTYCRLLQGRIPNPAPGLEVTSRFEFARGKSLSLDLTFLDWLKLRDIRQRESKKTVTVGPTGEIVLEECESLQKTAYRWDGIQFLSLVSRETTSRGRETASAFWSWAIEGRLGRERLRSFLRMALHSGIIRQFTVPPKSVFPVRVQLLLGTRFSRPGLEEVKLAGQPQKWKALVRALELADPDKYTGASFWRDWIDYPGLRSLIDRDPVQADLATRYPVANRTETERTLVVQRYRAVKRFLALLEHWKREENTYVLKSFDLGIDLPIFVFFHLLCPPELRSSAAVLSGDLEQTWGDAHLFEEGD
ncbi:MAG: hypothetical protein ACE15E_12515 [Acidobacteriota bacterium]